MKKLVVVLLVVAALYGGRSTLRSWLAPGPKAEPSVVLYATEWCKYCRMARRFLIENNIDYVEYDIEKSPEGNKRYEALGGRGVPLLDVNGRVIRGYNPDEILAALR